MSVSYQLKAEREEEANVTGLDQEYCEKRETYLLRNQSNLQNTISYIYLIFYLRKCFSADCK